MTQKVLKVGTSAAVTIPKDVMKKLGLKIGDKVKVGLNEKTSIFEVCPEGVLSKSEKRIAKITLDVIRRYRKDLESLSKK